MLTVSTMGIMFTGHCAFFTVVMTIRCDHHHYWCFHLLPALYSSHHHCHHHLLQQFSHNESYLRLRQTHRNILSTESLRWSPCTSLVRPTAGRCLGGCRRAVRRPTTPSWMMLLLPSLSSLSLPRIGSPHPCSPSPTPCSLYGRGFSC